MDNSKPLSPSRIGSRLFLLCFCLYGLTTTGAMQHLDHSTFFALTESIVERQSLAIDIDYTWAGVKAPYTYFSSGYSVLTIPFYLLGKLAAFGFAEESRRPIIELFVSLANPLFCAMIVWLFFRFAMRIRPESTPALIASSILAFATVNWYRSKFHWREPLAALLLLGTIYLLVRSRAGKPRRRMFQASLCFFLLTWLRFEQWALFPFLTAYLIGSQISFGERLSIPWKKMIGSVLIFSAVPLLAIPLFLAFNQMKFGSPFQFGLSYMSLFASPLWIGLTGSLASATNGLLIYSAPVILGAFAMKRFWNTDRALAILLTALILFMTIFYSKFSVWSGHMNVGPRYLFPVIPLLLLPSVLILDFKTLGGWGAAGVLFLAGAGLIVQVILVLGNWFVFLYRYTQFFGLSGEFITPSRFVFSPLATFLQQIRIGDFDPVWFHLAERKIPGAFLLLPVLFLAGAAFSALFLARIGNEKSSGTSFRQGLSGRTFALLTFLGIAALCCFSVVALERAFNPRGLELSLFGDFEQAKADRPLARLTGQIPMVDDHHNMVAKGHPEARIARWDGYLHIPSNHFNNHFHLATKDECILIVDDQVQFQTHGPDSSSGNMVVLQKESRHLRGFHSFRVLFQPKSENPYLSFRWTVQEYAFRKTVDKANFFRHRPGPIWAKLIDLEFYFLLLALIFLYAFIGTAWEAKRKSQ